MSGSTAPHPPYRVPGMAEIRALPWNGYRVVSTFSGGGGSRLGFMRRQVAPLRYHLAGIEKYLKKRGRCRSSI